MTIDIHSNEQLEQYLRDDGRLKVITVYNNYCNSDISDYKQAGDSISEADFLFINAQILNLNEEFSAQLTNTSLPCTTYRINGQLLRQENNLPPELFKSISESYLSNQHPLT